MIHLAFPNVAENGEDFCGCGRYLSQPPQQANYVEAEPRTPNLMHVLGAAVRFAPTPSASQVRIYETRDRKEPYQGPSLDLAYYLALIRRARRLRYEGLPEVSDFWCTGAIEWANGSYILRHVFQGQFDIKLQAFLGLQAFGGHTNTDTVFLVPHANLTPSNLALCEQYGVRILRLAAWRRLVRRAPASVLQQQTVIALDGSDLRPLVRALFKSYRWPRELRWFAVRAFGVGMFCGLGLAVLGSRLAIPPWGKAPTLRISGPTQIAGHPRPVLQQPDNPPSPDAPDTQLLQVAASVTQGMTIEAPRDNEVIDGVYNGMHGTYTADLPSDSRLWVVAQDQYNYFLMYPPTHVGRAQKRWSQTNVRLGPGRWTLHVCVANQAASQWLQARADKADFSGFAQLPPGLEPVGSVTVDRR